MPMEEASHDDETKTRQRHMSEPGRDLVDRGQNRTS